MLPGGLFSAVLASLYLQGGISIEQRMSPPPAPYTYWRWDINEVHNPYGVIEIGLETDPMSRWQLQLALRHASSIQVNDRGINSAELRLKWKPFQR